MKTFRTMLKSNLTHLDFFLQSTLLGAVGCLAVKRLSHPVRNRAYIPNIGMCETHSWRPRNDVAHIPVKLSLTPS